MAKNKNEFDLNGFYKITEMIVSSLILIVFHCCFMWVFGVFFPLIFVSALKSMLT